MAPPAEIMFRALSVESQLGDELNNSDPGGHIDSLMSLLIDFWEAVHKKNIYYKAHI